MGPTAERGMSPGSLGLFDTPPTRSEIRFSLVLVGLLVFFAFLFVLPFRDIEGPRIDAFVPVIDGKMAAFELITGFLLFAQAAVYRSRALCVLAAGYLFGALMLVAHALAFPGAFAPQGVLGGGVSTAAWCVVFRRLVFPVAIIAYVLLKGMDVRTEPGVSRRSAPIVACVGGTVLVGVLTVLLATAGHDLLPPLFVNDTEGVPVTMGVLHAITIALILTAMVLLFRQNRSVLDLWLLVVLSGWLAHCVLNFLIQHRFTVGFYSLYVVLLVSSLVLMVALIAESGRLYTRLARALAATQQELDNRLMSMDALGAMIAHEVGQPLAAVSLNTAAGIDSLTRKPPDLDRALRLFQASQEAGRLAFDVIKSIRSSFPKGSKPVDHFSLNNLVRETVVLLDRDLTVHKVSIDLALDETLPPVQANRTQIQRVIFNLVINAVDSLSGTRGRVRRISIRSEPADGGAVLLQVSDTGGGISPEAMTQLFEPFFTTKAQGMGLGLPLSRSIVESHGGRLWATTDDDRGATFHLQLPAGAAGS